MGITIKNMSSRYNSLSLTYTQSSKKDNTKSTTSMGSDTVNIGNNRYANNTAYNTYTKQAKIVGPYDPIANRNIEILTSVDPKDYEAYWNKIEARKSKTASKDYAGSLTVDEMVEKYRNGDDVTEEERHFMLHNIGFGDRFNTARVERLKALEEKNLSGIFKRHNISLNPDEELNISVDSFNKVTVTGINDPEKLEKIEEALNSEPNDLRG